MVAGRRIFISTRYDGRVGKWIVVSGLLVTSLNLTSLSSARDSASGECIGTHAWHLSGWLCGQGLNRSTGYEGTKPVPLPPETADYPWRGDHYLGNQGLPERASDPC
jgi:hypothetical protein